MMAALINAGVALVGCILSFALGYACRGTDVLELRHKLSTLRRWYAELDDQHTEQGHRLCEEAFARELAEQTASQWRDACARLETTLGLRPRSEREKHRWN